MTDSGKPLPGDLSSRDWFAGQIAPVTWQQATVMGNIGRCSEEQVPIIAAGLAYAFADAMMEVRNA